VGTVKTVPGAVAAAVGEGAVWVTSGRNKVFLCRIDPKTRKLTAKIRVGPKPRFLAVRRRGGVDPQSRRRVGLARRSKHKQGSCDHPGRHSGKGGDIAIGEGFVWVTAQNVPLTKIDPRTNKVVVQFVGEGGDALRVGGGAIWLCSFFLHEAWHVSLDF
jgi:streptogramin lyase